VYLTRNDSFWLDDLYHWPADFPPQTFQEPGRPGDLLVIEWANYQEEDEEEEYQEEAVSISEDNTIVKTIREGDKRIGMYVFSIIEEMGGHLDSIEVYADGFERWTVILDGGKKIIDGSDLFWLEISEYQHLFTARVLDQDALYQKLREALALYEEK